MNSVAISRRILVPSIRPYDLKSSTLSPFLRSAQCLVGRDKMLYERGDDDLSLTFTRKQEPWYSFDSQLLGPELRSQYHDVCVQTQEQELPYDIL
jgi:hypothetical protein